MKTFPPCFCHLWNMHSRARGPPATCWQRYTVTRHWPSTLVPMDKPQLLKSAASFMSSWKIPGKVVYIVCSWNGYELGWDSDTTQEVGEAGFRSKWQNTFEVLPNTHHHLKPVRVAQGSLETCESTLLLPQHPPSAFPKPTQAPSPSKTQAPELRFWVNRWGRVRLA